MNLFQIKTPCDPFWRPLGTLLLCVSCVWSSIVDAEDPFGAISVDELKNGLKVVFSPSGESRQVRVELRVLAGWNAENSSNAGAAHLVKSAVFRDERGQSQTKRIEIAGGTSSSEVTPHYTVFRINVPSIKGTWAINELSRVLNARTLTGSTLENARTDALKELGRGERIQDVFWSWMGRSWRGPDFLESEFGVAEKLRTPEVLRRSLPLLSQEQAADFYARFYAPSNMVLFLSGPFKRTETMAFVKETFEPFADREKKMIDPAGPVPRSDAYVRSRTGGGETRIEFGTKFWDIQPEDEMCLRVYFDHLAKKLNLSLLAGQSDDNRAEPVVWTDSLRYGYAYVGFSVPKVFYSRAKDEAQRRMRSSVAENGFDESEARKAIDEYLENWSNASGPSEHLFYFQSMYQTKSTPYEILEDLRPEDLIQRLGKLLERHHSYLSLREPSLLFDEESWVLYLCTLGALVFATRLFFKRKFEHTGIRYVRRIRYSPLLNLVFAGTLLVLVGLLAESVFLANRVLLYWNFFQSTFVLNTYVRNSVWIALFFSLTVSFLCVLPRKLMVCGDTLILKSMSYAARRHPVSEISEVYVCRPWHIYSQKLWNKRLWMLHWTPWRKGILIRFEDGGGYYLGFRHAEKVASELHEVFAHRPLERERKRA